MALPSQALLGPLSLERRAPMSDAVAFTLLAVLVGSGLVILLNRLRG